MDFGAHLPLMDFGGHPYTLDHLVAYTRTAAGLGFSALAANDHLVFPVPWLDGPTALAAVLEHSGDMTLATSVALAVVRHPVPTAKTLGALDRLSGGRLVVGVGPGSSADDYAAVGLDFAERWKRLDESVGALRALWRTEPFVGRFYSTEGITLAPAPAQPGGPPVWVGSWGSDAGLRRVARLADGWLASAYNTTPAGFADAWRALRGMLADRGRDGNVFPNALATMWFYVTDDAGDAARVLQERVVPTVHRPEDVLRDRLPIGPAEKFAEKLTAFARVGVQRVLVWPVADEVHQLERFWHEVRPLVRA
ncbi:MAG TPA: LLM class flavin-dependent oxidoreductase [Acidimicrobiia bacterium]|jgi:alkanesulfonate monooxygenase SsuD/methylene tetrahydromethanopterin reductase-like flavin-dependent oxidoreductase (luciferase family)